MILINIQSSAILSFKVFAEDLLTRGAWAATSYSSRLVCLFVCDCESTHLDATALRLQFTLQFTAWIALKQQVISGRFLMLNLRCRIKAKKLVSESAYLDVITVRLQHG